MLFWGLPWVLRLLPLVTANSYSGAQKTVAPSLSSWKALNSSVGGRLRTGVPLARPCFELADTAGATNQSECAAIRQGWSNSLFLVENFGAYMNTQWGSCQATSQSCLIHGINSSDPAPSDPPNICRQGSVPPYYIDVRDASDVQKALAFSKNTGIPLVVKNTGHDYLGRSSAPGALALWTHNLKAISYHAAFVPSGCPVSRAKPGVTMGAGVIINDAVAFAEQHNITLVLGAETSVGPSGGWVMGGGHGALANTQGLGADRVLEFKLVTPTGQLLVANECQHTDLFWALRGGGGGTFGVVLESTALAAPRLTLQVAFAAFSRNNTNATRGLYEVVAENSVSWAQQGFGGYIEPYQALYVTPTLNSTATAVTMKPLFDYVASLAPKDPGVQFFSVELPSYGAFHEAFLAGSGATVGENAAIASRLIPTANFANASSRATLVDALMETLAHVTFDLTLIATTPFNVPDDGTTSVTPAWRNSIWHAVAEGGWDGAAPRAQEKVAYSGISAAADFLRAITPGGGAYQNEADVHEPNHETSFWGPNYPRLLQIKKKYDPDNILTCWHCVGYNPADPRFACYI
ncbi:FAD-binding domain-containing protein [Mycena indigotica]|uniref:FAD-binding domain-containing protein n=1 Tax=Mycena indigotica TaxID=2126181 RepID=A0A8H6TGR2_9AGAR|nr:FAD-binding domain-containing protein [Mycena indigotica]KAF7316391.1 FAD-binding domain-containing protein [Mycena indigotica]